MMFLIRFWSPLTKRTVWRVLNMNLKNFLLVLTVTVIVRGALRTIVDGVGRLARTNK